MKQTMTLLAAVMLLLFMMMSLATARSLPDKEMEKKLMLTRREAELENQTDAVTYNLTDIQDDLVNLSIPNNLKELYINLTYFGGDQLLHDLKINTVRAYENQAKCKRT